MLGSVFALLWSLISYVFRPTFLAVVAAVVTAGYFYATRHKHYWADRGVKHLPYKFPFGQGGFDFFKRPIHETFSEIYKKAREAGGCLPMFDSFGVAVAVSDPEILRHIMVKDFEVFPIRAPQKMKLTDGFFAKFMTNISGQEWRDVRNISTPAFSTGKIRLMSKPCVTQAEALAGQMYTECQEAGGEIELKQILGRYTMDNIASVAFAQEANTIRNPKSTVAEMAKAIAKRPGWIMLSLFMVMSKLPQAIKSKLKTTKLVFNTDAAEYFGRIITEAIRQRTANPDLRRGDYLQMLLDTRDEDKTSKRQLTDEEIVAQCVLFYIAGYDTTSTALTWAMRCIAHNPDVQRHLQADIDDKLSDNATITFDFVSDMTYLDNVLSETLRLYSIIQNARSCCRPYRIPGTNIDIEPDTMVYMYPYAMHRDHAHWPDPEKFDPDRFLPENKAKRHPYAYMPFGHGPRNCIGMRFALLQCKLAIVAIMRHFNVTPGSKSSNPQPKLKNSGAVEEEGGTWIKLEKRA